MLWFYVVKKAQQDILAAHINSKGIENGISRRVNGPLQ